MRNNPFITGVANNEPEDYVTKYKRENGLLDEDNARAGSYKSSSENDTINNGVFGNFIDAAQAGAASTAAGQMRFAGEFMPFGNDFFNSSADVLDDIARRNTPVHELDGSDYVASAVGNAVGSGGLTLAEGALLAAGASALAGATGVAGLAGAGGAAAGAANAGKLAKLGSTVAKIAQKLPAAKRVKDAAANMWQKPFGKMLAANVAGSPAEATAEAGNLITEMRQEGYTDDEIREAALESAAYNTAWLTVANMLESKAFGKIADKYAQGGNTAKGLFKAGALGGASGAASEGVEEYGQNLIGDFSKGVPFDYGAALDSAKMGAVGGGVLGGLGGGLGAYLNREQPNIPQEVEEEPIAQPSVVDNVRNLEGKIPYYADDGTNCMRTLGIALRGTPYEGQINVDEAINTARENGQLMDPNSYTPQPGDIAVVNGGNHAVMVTDKGGTIQNGESHNGVYESDLSPVKMFGGVDYYIRTSDYNNNAVNADVETTINDDGAEPKSEQKAQESQNPFAETALKNPTADVEKNVPQEQSAQSQVPQRQVMQEQPAMQYQQYKQQTAENPYPSYKIKIPNEKKNLTALRNRVKFAPNGNHQGGEVHNIGSYDEAKLKSVRSLSDDKLTSLGHTVAKFSNEDKLKQAVITELNHRGMNVGDGFNMADNGGELVPYGVRSVDDVKQEKSNKEHKPSNITEVAYNPNQVQSIIDKYKGNTQSFHHDYEQAVKGIEKAYKEGRATKEQAQKYMKYLEDVYNQVMPAIYDNGTIYQQGDAERDAARKAQKSEAIGKVVAKARVEQEARKQKALDDDWYRMEHEHNSGNIDQDWLMKERERVKNVQGDTSVARKALTNEKVNMLTERAVGGNPAAQKAFKKMSPAVRRALLNRVTDRLQAENEKANNEIYKDYAEEPFVPVQYWNDPEAFIKGYNRKAYREEMGYAKKPFMPDVAYSEARAKNGSYYNARTADALSKQNEIKREAPASEWDKAAGLTKEQRRSNKPFVPQPQEVQNAQTEKTAESKGNDENSVLERNPQEQADYQGENKNGEAEEIEKEEPVKQIKTTVEKSESKPVKKSGAASVINDYKHTTKKTMIKAAKLDKDFSDDEFKEAKELAEENGGFYSKYASQKLRTKGVFLFEKGGAEGRDAFIAALNEKFGDKQEASVEPALERGITRDVDAEQNNKARERIAAENKNESQENKGYRTSNRDWGTTVNVKNNEVTISFNKSFGNMPPIKFTVAEYQKAAVSSVNRLSGIRKFLMPKVDAHNQEWIDAAPNENVRLAREDDVAMHGKDLADVLQKLVDTAMEKAGIEAADLNTLFDRAKTKNIENKEDVQKAEIERVAKEVSKEPSLGMYARKGDRADFVRHYMNVAEDTISELGEDEPLSIDSVSTKELEKMFTPHMVKLYDEIRAKDKSVVKVTESAKQKQLKADFGDSETATNELAAALGIKRKQKAESKPAPKKKAFDIVDDSDEALAKAIKEAKAELNKLSANPVFNPALHKAAFKVGAILIQRGANNFVEWSAKMLEMLGEKIRPWLGSVWKSIEAYPKNEKFDDEKATAATRYVGAKYNEGYISVEDIYNAFAMDFDPENLEAYKGLIDSAFAGIDELYNPTLDTADTKNVVQSSKENTAKEVEANDVDARENAGEKENSSDGGSNRRGLPKREKNLQTREDRDTRPDQVLGRKQAENDSTPKETRNIKSVRNNENSDSGRQISGESGRGDVRDGRTGTSVPVQADVAGEPRRGNSEPRRITENYHIDNPDALIGGTPRVRFSRNKKAIEIAQDLIGNDRPVTAEERDALAGYIGWGSFGQELFQGSWEKPVYKDGWEDENNWLRETLGEQAWKEAQNSIINAHYTDPYTINAMWEMARQLGFKGGRVLEPSMGVGNFFGLMPKDLAEKSKLTGIELDQTTGRMAQVLYPEANVQIKGYQDSHTPEGFYDFIIGNVPFGNFSIASRKYNKLKPLIHYYFFLKGIDELKSGGIMMAITSKGTMDKADARVRMELAKKADLVAAYRLPTGAFDQYAGTNVVTDILVFKKLDKPRIGVSNLEWVNATKYEVEFEGKDQSYYMNDYFKNHPENVLGKTEYGHGTTTGRPGLTVKRLSDFAERLEAIPYEVPQNIFSASNADANIQYISNHTGKEQGSLTLEGDKLYTVYGDVLKPLEDTKSYAVKDIKKTTARVQEFKDWMQLRDTLGELYDAERKDGQDMEQIRKKLNQQFDDYCEKYVKPSMAKENSPAFRQSYANKFLGRINEPFAARVQALVSNTGEKTSIFFKRTIRGNSVDIDNPTIAQALIMQRNESMVLDVDRIAELAHKSKAETIKELLNKNIVFKTPAGNYETKDNYLAGNVRQKLREAEDALNNGDKDMKHNVEELKKVIPPTVPYYQISAPLGSSWIPNETYIDFIAHLLGGNRNGIALNKTKNYSVSIEKNNGLGTASKIYGSDDVPFARMLTHAFNHTKPTITKKDSEGNTYRDEQAMQRAADQLEKIYDEFSNWLWKDSSRKISLENAYNEAMNSIAVPTYDGSFMDMPGMALERGESPFSLRQHQLNAIYRGLLNGSGIYAHEVGTGKTYTMAGLAIESRRYGLAKKPLLLAFNANSASVAKEINDMYPGAKVLYIDNLDRKSIQLRLNQIKTDDWDCVVMPHSLADKLSFREETLNAMAEQQIYELEQAAIAAAKEEDEELTVEDMEKLRLAEADKGEERKKLPYIKSQTAKKLVTMRNQVINQIKQQALNSTDEDAIAFEDLGIDMVMVDEAHAFKKPPFTTTRNIKGLAVTTSNRSIKLSFISQYIQSLHNGKGIHLFTGTPITNTLTEMYHMMKYVMPNAMEDAGVKDFDSWMNSFAEEVSDMEFTSTGDVELVSRLAAFTNVPELRRFVGQYWDTVFADDMPEFKPRETKSGKNIGDKLTEEEQDELVNGYTEDPQGRPYKKVIVETLQLTKSQQEILDELVKKAKNWAEADGRARREIRKTEFHATPLLIGNDASIAAMDPRLYDLNVDTTGEETKKDRCVKNVLKIYNEGTKQHPTVQVIFSDVGYSDTKDQSTPNPEGGPSIKRKVPTFNLSKAIVEDLVKGGIPENEIVVMKASYSAEKRAQIADELKTGKYRVVIGSTATLGVGVNMQDNLRAMHHLDCPWMPGDLVQRNGRGHRQGNHWNTVLEYRYVTEKLDTKRWQTVLRKDAFITSFMKSKVGDVSSRSFEMGADDVGDSAADSDLLKTLAEASGDPRIILQKKYETNLTKLERKERTFLAGIEDMKASLIAAKKGIENAQLAYETSVKDAKRFLDNKPEPFEISLVNSLKLTVKRELVKFDNRTEAQKHLQQILSEVMNIDTDNNIGEYAGFKIIVKKVRSDMEGKYVPEISIKGDQKYTCGTPSVQAITMKPASIAKLADDEKAKKARLEEEVKRLEIAVQEKFPQQEQLDRTKKQLEDVKLDRLMSPTPPPKWLMEGVNVDSMFYVDKDPYILTGYRANSDGYYLVGTKNDGTEKIFPFQDATDIQGMPVYDMAEHVPSPVYKAPKAENPKYSIAPQTAYHGSNRVFNEFRLDHSKEGHGDLTHGYGVYFAADEKIANSYRRDLSGMAAGMEFTIRGENYRYDSEDNVFRGTSGNEISINAKTPEGLLANAFYMTEDADDAVEYLKEQQQKASEKLKPMYQKALELARKGNLVVNLGGATYESLIPSVEEMIDEDATYSEQPEVVKRGIDKAFNELGAQKQLDEVKRKDLYGNNIYVKLMQAITGDNSRVDETMYFIDENEDVARQASELLDKHGVKGLRYDGEVDGEAFVVFNEKAIEIKRRYEANLERAAQRTREEVLNEVKKALPTAKISYDSKGNLIAEMPNSRKVGVVVEDRILLNQQQAKSAGKAHNTIANEAEGYWNAWEKLNGSDVLGVIHVSRNSRVGTAFHEVLHAAMDLSLTAKEKEALYKHFKKAAEKSGRDIDEEIADGYKDWVLKRQQGQGSLFGKLFQKAKDFLNKLYTMFVEADNKGNIFRKLESGEAWKQQTYSVSEAPKFNITSADIEKFINVALKNPAKHLRMVLGKVSNAEAEAIKKATGMDVNNFTHVWFSEDVRHIKNRHGAGNEKDKRQVGLTQEDIEKAIDVIKSPDRIEKGATDKGRESIRFMKANNKGEYTVVEVVSNNKKQLAIKTMWNKKEAVTTKRHADKISPQYTSESGSGNTASMNDTVSSNNQEVKYSVAHVHKVADAFTNTERKTVIQKAKDFFSESKKDFRTQWLDKNHSLKGLDEITQMTGDLSVYDRVQNLPSTTAGMLKAICEGTPAHIDKANQNLSAYKMQHRVTLAMALDKINKAAMDKAHPKYLAANGFKNWVDALGAYLGAERLLEMNELHIKEFSKQLKAYNERKAAYEEWAAKGRQGLPPQAAIHAEWENYQKALDKAYRQWADPKGNNKKGPDPRKAMREAWAKTHADEKEPLKTVGRKPLFVPYKMPNGLTASELKAFSKAVPQEFREAADIFYKVNDNIITVMADAQVFSKGLGNQLRTKYKRYCPLLRDFSDTAAADNFINGLTMGGRGIGNVSIPLKKIGLEGSDRSVLNPLETVMKSYAVMLNRAERNKVGLMAVRNAYISGLTDLIQPVPEVKGKDGKVVNAVADPKNCIFTVLINGKKKAFKTTQELYSPIVGYNLPAASLCLNVARVAANMLRTGATMSPSFIIRNFLRDTVFAAVSSQNGFIPFVDSIKGALALWNDPAMRAEFEAAGVTEFNFYASQNARVESLDKMAGYRTLAGTLKGVFRTLEDVSDFVESSTRMGEFMKARKAGKSMKEAARAGREITLDFSRSGVMGEQLNRYIPFFNACLQGSDKMYQLFRQDFTGTALKMFKYIVLPSMILYAMNYDEDWYKELNPELKNNYWFIGESVRIPKPQEAGVLFGSGIEALLDQAMGKDKDAVENWLKTFLDNMSPSIIPTLVLPLLEWESNYSLFRGREIVSKRYQHLPDELQYNDYTSETSKAIGKTFKVSPMKIDSLVRGYTGTMGALIWSLPDHAINKATKQPAKHWYENAPFRDFTVTDANRSRPMNEFYELLNKANQQHAGYGRKGNPKKAVQSVRTAGKLIAELNKDIQTISGKKISPEQKRLLIDNKRKKAKLIAEKAVAKYGKYFQ